MEFNILDIHAIFQNVALYLITALLGYISYKLKFVVLTYQLLIKAVQIILGQLIRNEYKQASLDNWVSINTFRRVEEMYSVYHGLNGNGGISGLWEHFKKFEIREMEAK